MASHLQQRLVRLSMRDKCMLFISVTQENDLDDYTCVARNGQSSPAQRLVRLSMRGKCMLIISVTQESDLDDYTCQSITKRLFF